ncbi:MAG: hypothetical protein ACRCX2_32425 [Paraclostridium sp.]
MIIIKTQDKETVGRFVEVKANENVISGFSSYGSMTVLGNYSSRERAIEVVEQITKIIIKGTCRDYMDGKFRIKQDHVFYMPAR